MTFDKNHPHPFSAINIAVIRAAGYRMNFPHDYCIGNTFCPLRLEYTSDDYYNNYEYEFNDDGIYDTDYYYFEYESD